jgi:hypothetical protein
MAQARERDSVLRVGLTGVIFSGRDAAAAVSAAVDIREV